MHVSTIIGEKGNAVYTIEPGQRLSDAVDALCKHKVGAMVVVDKGTVVGIFSERDLIRAIGTDGGSILSSPGETGRFMSPGIKEKLKNWF